MSVKEKIIEKLDTMSDEMQEKALAIITILAENSDSGSELAEIIGEEEFNRVIEECKDEKNIHGPYKNAVELIEDALKD